MYIYSERRERNVGKMFITIILTVIVTVVVMKFLSNINEITNNNDLETDVQRLSEVKKENPVIDNEKNKTEDFVSIVNDNMPSVVGVSVLKPDGIGILDFDVTEKWGIGTGIVLSEKGYILTNQHLASKINMSVTVTLDNGEEVNGKVIWNEANLDLAIIKIEERDDLKPVELGSIEKSKIGEDVIAIGNPLGLEFQKSVTKGVISGLNRTLKVEDNTSTVVMESLIQTDASINTGNSGGPLINKEGKVIGVNTVKITSAEGIGFAVPIDIIKPILYKLERDGNFKEGYLGIFAYDSEIVPYLNKTIETNSGIYVASVNHGGPAYSAGIKVGDIILSVNGYEINKMTELRKIIYENGPGNRLKLRMIRDGKELEIEVLLGNK